jgi:hypothetical protein
MKKQQQQQHSDSNSQQFPQEAISPRSYFINKTVLLRPSLRSNLNQSGERNENGVLMNDSYKRFSQTSPPMFASYRKSQQYNENNLPNMNESNSISIPTDVNINNSTNLDININSSNLNNVNNSNLNNNLGNVANQIIIIDESNNVVNG